jgi:hypothetical protein
MKKIWLLLLVVLLGCGYTTRGFNYAENGIYIEPVVNEIDITNENRAYSSYSNFPVLLEKQLTNALIEKFNINGSLLVANQAQNNLRLVVKIKDYKKDALRYADSDDVTEHKLKLYADVVLYDSQGENIKESRVVGEASYFLSGRFATSEAAAESELVDDAARRIMEMVIENW